MEKLKSTFGVPVGVVGLVAAVASWFLSEQLGLDGGVAAAFMVFLVALVVAVVGLLPRVVRWLSYVVSKFIASGFREWANRMRAPDQPTDGVFRWLTDQLLVAKHEFSFSIGCLAYRKHEGKVQVLLTWHEGLKGWVWPGGRYSSSTDQPLRDLMDMVERDTGVQVEILAPPPDPQTQADIYSWDPAEQRSSIRNTLVVPPAFMMVQRRRQSNEVPGHLDLLFIAEAKSDQLKTGSHFVDLAVMENGIGDFDLTRLWSDTRTTVRLGAETYKQWTS